jgi:transposase
MPSDIILSPARGHTVRDVAARYRVGVSRVLGWIRRGELRAINRRDDRAGRPAYVVTPEALMEFEHARSVSPPPKPARRKRRTSVVDYFPDL